MYLLTKRMMHISMQTAHGWCAIPPLQLIQNGAAQPVFKQPKVFNTTRYSVPSRFPVATWIRLQTLDLPSVLWMPQAHTTSSTWSNHTFSPSTILLIGFRGSPIIDLPSHGCLLCWLHSGGTKSPLTSGQQKLYKSFRGERPVCSYESRLRHLDCIYTCSDLITLKV